MHALNKKNKKKLSMKKLPYKLLKSSYNPMRFGLNNSILIFRGLMGWGPFLHGGPHFLNVQTAFMISVT